MTTILATRSGEARIKGEALIRTADQLLCESWNERMWADGALAYHRPSHKWRLQLARNRMLALQVAAECRPAGLPHPPTPSCMTWPAGSAAASAARRTAVRPPLCFNSRSAPAKRRRPENVQSLFDHHQPSSNRRSV